MPKACYSIIFLLGFFGCSFAQASVIQSDLSLLSDTELGDADQRAKDPYWNLAWHGRVASYGDPDSQFFIASVYEEGKLVPKDLKKAIEFYSKAAEQGHIESCIRLAHLLPDEALKWYELAANQNDPQSQIKLSQLYESLGDREKADYWLKKALRSLFPDVSDLTTVSPDLKRLRAQ